MNERKIVFKKLIKVAAFLLLIFVIGGLGGVYFDQHVLPTIRTNKYLSRINWLAKTAENVTVINKTEQVTIKEDDSINEVASLASNAVVNIASIAQQKDPLTKTLKNINLSGTGVLVTSDGMIVTYRSAIIENGANYKVFLFNGNAYDAKLVGVDNFTNLAFLKIDAPNLTAISFGDSSDVKPGKKMVSIGNSFGEYQDRYAAGLLSNIDKTFNLSGMTVASSDKLEGVFEDDFDNQKEYVGGPVIGYSGNMLGIVGVLSIDSKDVYFQIPSNVVSKAVERAVAGTLDQQPVLGAYYTSITKEYALANNLSQDRGALIGSPSGKQGLAVIAGSPAELAGLKVGDVITMVGNQGVNLDNPLSNLINQYKKGESVEITVMRAAQEIKITVKL